MSLLVLEGADGTGKTTLAKAIEKRNHRYVHNGPPPDGISLFEHYTQQMLAARHVDTVFDRLHVGELIYGPVMRGKSLITLEEMRLLNRLLFSMGGKVIFCDTNNEAILGNWLDRKGQEYVDQVEKIKRVAYDYRTLFDQEFGQQDTVVFDYNESYLLERVNQFFPYDEVPDFLRRKRCPEGVIGAPEAKFLIVGERVNPELSFGQDLAFYSMENSSGFLNRCLWDAGYKEHELSFTNARTITSATRDLYSLWTNDRSLVVITLGKLAAETCDNQAVPHLEVPHPQYVKRFEGKHRGRYIELLNRFRGEL